MAASKKLYSGYTEVTNNQLTDQVPILQNGNKKTTLQKIYNLFVNTLGSLFQSKQDVTITNINGSILNQNLESLNTILSITNIPSGTGNKTIRLDVTEILPDANNAYFTFTVRYNGHDVNLRSYGIFINEPLEITELRLYLNVHSSPTEPVIISMNKIN